MNKLLGAILLVAGTTIGAGMLALPVITGIAGFFPSLVLMVVFWFYMLLTAFYLLEVNLNTKGGNNLISMVRNTLGRPGEIVAWICYLLLLYSLISAYMVGCSQILSDLFGKRVPEAVWPPLLFFFFGTFVYFGTRLVDVLNRFLMVGLVAAYILLISLGIFHIEPTLLLHQKWSALLSSISVLATTFGYHIIIPSLTTYLNHDKKELKKAIVIGSLIPLIVYVLWQFLALGCIPLPHLESAASSGVQATICLKEIIGNVWVTIAARGFAFFAIVTSLLGVALSLSDFLADGLKIKREHLGIVMLTFVPPLCFALFYPKGFIVALQYAGIFVIVLLALFPTLMAWKSHKKVFGGKVLMVGSILLSIVLLGLEVFL